MTSYEDPETLATKGELQVFSPEDPAREEARPGRTPGAAREPTRDAVEEGAAGRGSSLPAFPAHLLPSDLSTSEAVTSSGQTMGDGPSIHSVYVCVPTDTTTMHAPRSFNLGGKGQFIQERPHTWTWGYWVGWTSARPLHPRLRTPALSSYPPALPHRLPPGTHSGLRCISAAEGGGGARQREHFDLPSKKSHTPPILCEPRPAVPLSLPPPLPFQRRPLPGGVRTRRGPCPEPTPLPQLPTRVLGKPRLGAH